MVRLIEHVCWGQLWLGFLQCCVCLHASVAFWARVFWSPFSQHRGKQLTGDWNGQSFGESWTVGRPLLAIRQKLLQMLNMKGFSHGKPGEYIILASFQWWKIEVMFKAICLFCHFYPLPRLAEVYTLWELLSVMSLGCKNGKVFIPDKFRHEYYELFMGLVWTVGLTIH